ncbi:aspartate/glutamate racemase family protein [Geodermatophilus chilensis]|uniref:aspartate/glutamate racemase family protein n=1 Tax=Geodermatophilus chilensis TaxID=2035835 RepID=UPI0038CC0060
MLLLNPNTNATTTNMMCALAAEDLCSTGMEVRGITVAGGPRMIIDPDALARSERYVREAVSEQLAADSEAAIAGVIVGAIGDPGRAWLSQECRVPVIGIGQASILRAGRHGRRFGMATSTPLLAGSLVLRI